MKTVNLMVDVSIPIIQHITSFQGLQLNCLRRMTLSIQKSCVHHLFLSLLVIRVKVGIAPSQILQPLSGSEESPSLLSTHTRLIIVTLVQIYKKHVQGKQQSLNV